MPWILVIILFISVFILFFLSYAMIKLSKTIFNDPSNFVKILFEIMPKIKTADFILSYMVVPISLLSLLFIFPYYQGNWDAQNLIEGESDNPKLVITLKDNGINLTNNALILVLYNDKNYYFIEENISAPLHPKSYIIPDSEIKMVTFLALPYRGHEVKRTSLSAKTIEKDLQYENARNNKSLLSNN